MLSLDQVMTADGLSWADSIHKTDPTLAQEYRQIQLSRPNLHPIKQLKLAREAVYGATTDAAATSLSSTLFNSSRE